MADAESVVISHHSGMIKGQAEDDRRSVLSAKSYMTDRRSIAPSILLHDFNGKKAKVLQTLK